LSITKILGKKTISGWALFIIYSHEVEEKMSEERLIEIETKIAFQEQTIKELNDVIYEQQQEIDRLGSICDALVKRVKEFSEVVPGIDAPADEKPPHY
jgi:SlyX protein